MTADIDAVPRNHEGRGQAGPGGQKLRGSPSTWVAR